MMDGERNASGRMRLTSDASTPRTAATLVIVLLLPIDEHGEISVSSEDELDETGIGLAMLIGRVGDHHPHFDAAAFEGHRTFDAG